MRFPLTSTRQQSGFTLLEVLIAVTITAVIGLGVWQVLSGVIASRDRVNELAKEFEGLQRVMLLLERDLLQIVNRPARDVYGDYQFALTSREDDFSLILTRQGWRNPRGDNRSWLQRVAWDFTGEELRRRYWPKVDQGQEDLSTDALLLERVLDFEVRFLNDQRAWQPEWPTDEMMASYTPGSRPEMPLPLGIEITLEHERFGELVRTFVLPNFDAEEAQSVVNRANEASDEDSGGEAPEDSSTADGQGQGG